jgi:uncharacterized DUF497 family protein
MLFAWDEGKAEENERKHRVTFAEAETVFDEPLAKTFLDPAPPQPQRHCLPITQAAQGQPPPSGGQRGLRQAAATERW